jgi:hypothetical protein
MRELLVIARGMATCAFTGLGLLVVLRGDGASTHIVLGSLLIATGLTIATIGVLVGAIEGRVPEPERRRS